MNTNSTGTTHEQAATDLEPPWKKDKTIMAQFHLMAAEEELTEVRRCCGSTRLPIRSSEFDVECSMFNPRFSILARTSCPGDPYPDWLKKAFEKTNEAIKKERNAPSRAAGRKSGNSPSHLN